MRRIAVLALVPLAGCDILFGLRDVDGMAPVSDARSDGRAPDGAPPDAPVDAVVPTHSSCPNGFFGAYENSKYLYFSNAVSWHAAMAACLDLEDPTSTKHIHLAVLTSDLERSHVYTNVVFSASEYWIGLSDTKTEGTTRWVTDEPVPYPEITSWGDNEPSTNPGDDCVRIEYSNNNLDARQCSEASRYVCECDDFAVQPASYAP